MPRSIEEANALQLIKSHIAECDKYKLDTNKRDDRMFEYIRSIDEKLDTACDFITANKEPIENMKEKVNTLWDKQNWQIGAVAASGSMGAALTGMIAWFVGIFHTSPPPH